MSSMPPNSPYQDYSYFKSKVYTILYKYMGPYGKLQKGKGKFPPASGLELSAQFLVLEHAELQQLLGFGL